MGMVKKEHSVLSCDGIHELKGRVYIPDGEIKGFFHVVHGMTEHIDRYDRFMSDICSEGFVCFGYNHLGHKGTASDNELGYIAKKDGWDLLARDVKVFSDSVFDEFKRGDRPYYLMGHSMGSFVVRYASAKYVSPDKLIVMGTGGSNPAANAGLALIELIKLFRSDKSFSPFIDKVAFGGYNKRFGGGSDDDPKPWLTNDEKIRKIYYNDKYCMFKFSLSAMGDLIRIMKYSNSSFWYNNVSPNMPVLLVSGVEDPVGNYGKGIEEVYNKLQKVGVTVKMKLYPNARHEILNDFTYDEVKKDILDFCMTHRSV